MPIDVKKPDPARPKAVTPSPTKTPTPDPAKSPKDDKASDYMLGALGGAKSPTAPLSRTSSSGSTGSGRGTFQEVGSIESPTGVSFFNTSTLRMGTNTYCLAPCSKEGSSSSVSQIWSIEKEIFLTRLFSAPKAAAPVTTADDKLRTKTLVKDDLLEIVSTISLCLGFLLHPASNAFFRLTPLKLAPRRQTRF